MARQITFDISGWVEEFGDGIAVVLVRRPKESSTYPATISLTDGQIVWPVTSTDTAIAGNGACELQYIVGGTIVKSRTMRTLVASSLEDAGDTPEAESGWIASLIEQFKALYTALPDVTDAKDGTILVTLAGEWTLLHMGLEDITEEAF